MIFNLCTYLSKVPRHRLVLKPRLQTDKKNELKQWRIVPSSQKIKQHILNRTNKVPQLRAITVQFQMPFGFQAPGIIIIIGMNSPQKNRWKSIFVFFIYIKVLKYFYFAHLPFPTHVGVLILWLTVFWWPELSSPARGRGGRGTFSLQLRLSPTSPSRGRSVRVR